MNFKFTVELCVMTMRNDTKIEEELTCHFKIDMNFTKFESSTPKVYIFFYWLLVTKVYFFELQKYKGVIFHDTEELCTFRRKTD